MSSISSLRRAHLERAEHHFFFEDCPPQIGAGLALVLHFTARERDCYGCLRVSRAKLACSLRSGSTSLTHRVPRAGEGGGLMLLGARRSHRPQIWEPAKEERKLRKRVTTAEKYSWATQLPPAARGTGRRSQQVQGITIHLTLTACQHLTACVQVSVSVRCLNWAGLLNCFTQGDLNASPTAMVDVRFWRGFVCLLVCLFCWFEKHQFVISNRLE